MDSSCYLIPGNPNFGGAISFPQAQNNTQHSDGTYWQPINSFPENGLRNKEVKEETRDVRKVEKKVTTDVIDIHQTSEGMSINGGGPVSYAIVSPTYDLSPCSENGVQFQLQVPHNEITNLTPSTGRKRGSPQTRDPTKIKRQKRTGERPTCRIESCKYEASGTKNHARQLQDHYGKQFDMIDMKII